MGIVIRDADLIRDRDLILETLNQNRRRKKDLSRYDWLYLQNPFGVAKAWLAMDDKADEVAGVTAVFPRLMDLGGQEVLCWNCGDFSINQKFRTLGAAVKLRSEATRHVNSGTIPFLYAHPNDRMKAVHLRVGHSVLGEMVRLARVLKPDRYLGEHWQGTWMAKSMGWALNTAIAIKTTGFRGRREFASEIYRSFPEKVQFSELLSRVKSRYQVLGHRNADYLKWRFWDHPEIDASVLVLYRAGELVAYAIYTEKDGILAIRDMLYLPDDVVMNELLNRITDVGRQRGVDAISSILFESNPMIPMMYKHGYSLRPERSSVMVHVGAGVRNGECLKDKTQWYMTVGDRDV